MKGFNEIIKAQQDALNVQIPSVEEMLKRNEELLRSASR